MINRSVEHCRGGLSKGLHTRGKPLPSLGSSRFKDDNFRAWPWREWDLRSSAVDLRHRLLGRQTLGKGGNKGVITAIDVFQEVDLARFVEVDRLVRQVD